MSQTIRLLMALTLTLTVAAPAAVVAADDFPVSPALNEGRKWRVGYYQGGPYGSYRSSLLAIVAGLAERGWIHPGTPPEAGPEDTESIWRWLSDPARSDFLEFPADAFHDADWDDARRVEVRDGLLQRLSGERDLDLVIAMGTWAGRDLAVDQHSTPTVVVSTSDAVRAGIVASAEDSGRDHVHAHVDPQRFARHVRTFHDLVGFRRLGIVYQDTEEGRSYSGIGLVEQVAAERRFDVVRCRLRGQFGDEERVEPTVVGCFEYLAPTVDALYVVSQTGVNKRTLPELVEVAAEARVPTFAQSGSSQVREGMLLSLSRIDFRSIGLFHADVMAKVFNGASPRVLTQVFEEDARVSINLQTAERIGFEVPASVLRDAETFGEPASASSAEPLQVASEVASRLSARSLVAAASERGGP